MKFKEISVGLAGVVPVASYENLRPSFGAVIELQEGDDEKEAMKRGMELVSSHFDMIAQGAKIDLIEKQYENVKFREKDGKKYPRVSSIMGWDKDWKITPDQLAQYGARGHIVHKLEEIWMKDKKWVNPLDIDEVEIQDAINVLMSGSLNLSWKDCSHEAFMEKYGKDFEPEGLENVVFNEEHRYSGRYDYKGKFQGKRSIVDYKTGSTWEICALAAYAVCEPDIEQLVIIPIGPTKNKCGYNKPIISTDIAGEFKKFLYKRDKFKKRFGI